SAGAQVVKIADDWTYQFAPVREAQRAGFAPSEVVGDRLSAEEWSALRIFGIFPAFVILSVGELIQGLSFVPRTVNSVDVRVWSLIPRFASDSIEDLEAAKALIQSQTDAVNAEDEHGTAMLQSNALSVFAQRGWLSQKENALVGFFAYLARELQG